MVVVSDALALGGKQPNDKKKLKAELDKAYTEIVNLRMANTQLQGEVQALTRMIFDKDS